MGDITPMNYTTYQHFFGQMGPRLLKGDPYHMTSVTQL
jgi:hypothetical protein